MLLESYCCYISEFFSDTEVQEIHRQSDLLPWEKGRVGFAEGDPDQLDEDFNVRNEIRQSEVKWFDERQPLSKDLLEKIHEGVGEVARRNNWSSWEYDYLEPLQYTVYKHRPDAPVTGDFYTWHTDAGSDAYKNGSQRKLSFTLQLSHPHDYEGGHFEWLEPQHTFDNLRHNEDIIRIDDIKRRAPFSAQEKGSLIVFPSFVHHQVTPVIRGTRISLVGWLVGKPYI